MSQHIERPALERLQTVLDKSVLNKEFKREVMELAHEAAHEARRSVPGQKRPSSIRVQVGR